MSDTLQAGPCVICGGTNYNLSCGGPSICPKCDCGNFDAATVETQAKVISSLRQEIVRLRAALAATPRCDRCGSSGDVFMMCAGCQSPLAATPAIGGDARREQIAEILMSCPDLWHKENALSAADKVLAAPPASPSPTTKQRSGMSLNRPDAIRALSLIRSRAYS